MTDALEGLVVADFSRVLAGPYATMLLADLGAEVVKVERPGTGDDTRAWGPPWAPSGVSTYFESVNRGKTSVAIDLQSSEGRAQARELARRADVLVENFKPGTFDRAGLGYDALAADNPRLVYCSISGFGAGAGAALPGYDLLVQAVGGLMSVTGEPAHPTKAGVALVDVITGLHAVYGILAAVHQRDRTGRGSKVEVNLLSSLLSAMVNQSGAYALAGVVPEALGNEHPSIAPYAVFATADRPLVLAVGNDGQFRTLVEVLGAPELADDDRFATNPMRVAHRVELRAVLEALLTGRDAEDWRRVLTARAVPCGPVNDLSQAFALAESLGLSPVDHATGTVANPLRLSSPRSD